MDHIHVTVAAIIKRNNRYLLVKEQSSAGELVYNQPAGHVELRESLEAAVIREVKEETGLTFTPSHLIGTYLLSPAANGKTYLRFCFAGSVPQEEEAKPQDPDILSNHWFTLDEIKSIEKKNLRSAIVLQCLCDDIEDKSQPLSSLHFYEQEHQLAEKCYNLLSSD